ncbi:hypothetical protein CPLU01_10526 [Colletotrichum plurivorum]|uniref:Uncharacterized protein n=1 Tax=Colletotrichum plurivorum TaxID=2175906 RepID=A0A8H6N9B5_9PEZI|nr:hypothetical protein CPLU01_10526 [Colletotrichum plurivorum]
MSSPTATNSGGATGRVYKRRPGACETCKVRKRKCKFHEAHIKCWVPTVFGVILFLFDAKEEGKSESEQSPGPVGDLNTPESHAMSLSSAPDQLHYGANSSTSSISGIDQLLEASTMATPFGQISSHDEMWNPGTNSHFSSPEAMGSYPAEFVASPGSSFWDHGWHPQLYSVSDSPILSFGKCSATEWSQLQQPPQPLDERFQAVRSNFPPILHSCIKDHADNMTDVVRLFLTRKASRNGHHDFTLRLLDIHEECLKSHPHSNESTHDIHSVPADTHFRFAQGFCVEQHLGALYIDEAEFLQIFREVLGGDTSNAAKVALTYSALSISCSKSTERGLSTSNSNSLALAYYREGIIATEKLYTMAPSVLIFKALLTTSAASFLAALLYRKAFSNASWTILSKCRMQMLVANQLLTANVQSLNDGFIDHSPPTTPFGDEATPNLFLTQCRLAQLCSRMTEELQDYGAMRVPARQLDLAERAMRWIIVLQRFNSEVIEAVQRDKESIHADWGAKTVHFEPMGVTRPRSGVPAKLLTFEMALWSYGRMLGSKSNEPYLEKAEHAVAQFALEVLQILVEVDSSLAGSDGSFDQLVISSFCITAAYAHLLPDSATVFKRLVSTLGVFARISMTSSVVSLGKLSSVVDTVQKLLVPGQQSVVAEC